MKRLGALVIGMLLPGTGAAQAADTVYYYSGDTIHSEVVITDQNRNVVERTYYAPYGQVLNRDLRDGPGYSGHEEDPETNLVYMQQRYYDPEAGRFLSTDPVQADGNGGSFNRYEYANDNPYRYTDPDGRESGAGYATGEYTIALPPSSPEAREAALTMGGSGLSSSRRPRVRTKLLEWELRFVREFGMSVPRLLALLLVESRREPRKVALNLSKNKLLISSLKMAAKTE